MTEPIAYGIARDMLDLRSQDPLPNRIKKSLDRLNQLATKAYQAEVNRGGRDPSNEAQIRSKQIVALVIWHEEVSTATDPRPLF